jgi:hypothetical protein
MARVFVLFVFPVVLCSACADDTAPPADARLPADAEMSDASAHDAPGPDALACVERAVSWDCESFCDIPFPYSTSNTACFAEQAIRFDTIPPTVATLVTAGGECFRVIFPGDQDAFGSVCLTDGVLDGIIERTGDPGQPVRRVARWAVHGDL